MRRQPKVTRWRVYRVAARATATAPPPTRRTMTPRRRTYTPTPTRGATTIRRQTKSERLFQKSRNYIDDKTGEARKTSTWVVAYDLPREPGEPRRQAFKSGFRTRRDAEAWFTQKAEELRQGISLPDERMTVEQYLKQWLESISDSVSASALHAYRNHVELHIIPALGKVRLTELAGAAHRTCEGAMEIERSET